MTERSVVLAANDSKNRHRPPLEPDSGLSAHTSRPIRGKQVAFGFILVGCASEFLLRAWNDFTVSHRPPGYFILSLLFHFAAFYGLLIALIQVKRFNLTKKYFVLGVVFLLTSLLFDFFNDYHSFGLFPPLRVPPPWCDILDSLLTMGGFAGLFLAFANSVMELDNREEEARQARSEKKDTQSVLGAVIENIPIAVLRVDAADGKVHPLNESASQIFENTGQSIEGMDLQALGRIFELRNRNGKLLDIQDSLLGKALEGISTLNEEFEIVLPNGDRRWISGSATPILDEQGGVAGVLALFHDTTAKVKADIENRRSEERLRNLFDLGLIGMAITSPEKAWLEVNDALCEMLGYERAELVKKSWLELTHPEDVEKDVHYFNEVIDGKRDGYSLEKRFIHVDGRAIETAFSVKCTRREDGSVDHFMVLIQDITERNSAERALRESEQLYRESIELAGGVPYRQTRRKADGELVDCWVAKGFQDLTGYPPETCQNTWKKILLKTELLGDLEGMSEEEAIETCRRDLKPWTADFLIRARTGEERWVFNSSMNYEDPKGEFIHSIGILQDVSERRESQTLLNEQKSQLQAIVDAYPDSILLMDEDGEVVNAWSPCGRNVHPSLSSTLKEIPMGGCSLFAVTGSEETLLRFKEGLKKCLQNSGIVEIPYQIGDRSFLEARLSRCGDHHVLAVIRDVTQQREEERERQRFEEQVQHTQKLESLGILAGGIAHDFNNLLLSIMGNTDLASEEVGKDSAAREYIDQIEAAARRASDLTRQMLAYSGRGKFLSTVLDANQLLIEMWDLLKVSISKRAQIDFELSENLPGIHGDPSQIQQIIMNLVINASDALGEDGGLLVIRSGVAKYEGRGFSESFLPVEKQTEDLVFLEVEDHGCGMSDATLKRLFEPFYTTKFIGRGLGMAAVLGILRGHHGAFEIVSCEGSGTRVRILLPCIDHPGESIKPDTSTTDSIQGAKVLVVDDEPQVLLLVSRILQANQIECELAESGEKGLEILAGHPGEFKVALIDMTMPGINGIETIHLMSQKDPNVRFILSSGFSEEEILGGPDQPHLNGYIQKPYRPRDLILCINKTLAG